MLNVNFTLLRIIKSQLGGQTCRSTFLWTSAPDEDAWSTPAPVTYARKRFPAPMEQAIV